MLGGIALIVAEPEAKLRQRALFFDGNRIHRIDLRQLDVLDTLLVDFRVHSVQVCVVLAFSQERRLVLRVLDGLISAEEQVYRLLLSHAQLSQLLVGLASIFPGQISFV